MKRAKLLLVGGVLGVGLLLLLAPTTADHQRSLLEALIYDGTNGECWVRNDAVTGGGNWTSCGALSDGDYGDVLIDGGVWNIESNTIGDRELHAGTATDEYCLTYETDGGVLEWQTCGGGAGDSITVNTSAATDPDFIDGDIDWTLGGGGTTIAATVACTDCVNTTDILDGTVGTLDIATGGVTSSDLAADSLTPADLDAVAPAGAGEDEYCLTYEHGTTEFAWQTCSAGGGDNVSVDSAATTDPDFQDGDVDFTYAAGVVTATVGCSQCVSYGEIQNVATSDRILGRDTAGAGVIEELTTENILDMVTTWTNTALFQNGSGTWGPTNWTTDGTNITPAGDNNGDVGSGALRWNEVYAVDIVSPDGVNESDLDVTGAATDEYCLTYESTGDAFEWQTCGGGGVSDGDKGDITVSGGGAAWNIDADTITATEIAADGVTPADLDMTGSLPGVASDEYCATYEHTGTQFEFQLCTPDGDKGDITVSSSVWNIDTDAVDGLAIAAGAVDTAEIFDGSVREADLRVVDTAADEEVMTYESTTGDFEWHTKCDIAWPVDSIYISYSSTNPGTTMGCGTWSAFATGRMLIGVDGGKTWASAGATGGNLDMNHDHDYTQVPNHVHVQSVNSGTTGALSGYGVDTSTSTSATSGYSTANPTGGVATGTTGYDQEAAASFGEPVPWIAVYMWRRTA